MLQRSTVQLLRFPFSIFLMPVYWFALSVSPEPQWQKAILIFLIIHLLVYPSSNGYNSYMDRDKTAIGGLAQPMQPTRELYAVTVVLDLVAILLSFIVSLPFAIGITLYIFFSRLYSFRGIRLKQYPMVGYLTVVINQGALIFCLVYFGVAGQENVLVPWWGVLAATCLIGGSYPLTQVYQHAADKADGVQTLSMMLGIKGTFLFCAIVYLLAFVSLGKMFAQIEQMTWFAVIQLYLLPVLIYFVQWWRIVRRNPKEANFKRTMQMNWLASICTNLAFITITLLQRLG